MATKLEKGRIRIFHVRASTETILDEERIKQMLMQMVRRIRMTPHGRPKVVHYPVPQLGISGFAIFGYQTFHNLKRKTYAQELQESYIAVDTWPEQEYLNLIVNSCKFYRDEDVVDVIKEYLKPKKIWLGMEDWYSAEPLPGQKIVYERRE